MILCSPKSKFLSCADIAMAGENRTISILFSDIRGFTSLSERLSPDQVVNLLNRYFKPMTIVVRKKGDP